MISKKRKRTKIKKTLLKKQSCSYKDPNLVTLLAGGLAGPYLKQTNRMNNRQADKTTNQQIEAFTTLKH